jgi:transposase-like protein
MTFDEVVKEHHEVLGTTTKCYILTCGQDAVVVMRGNQSGNTQFYCQRCADELPKSLFTIIKQTN